MVLASPRHRSAPPSRRSTRSTARGSVLPGLADGYVMAVALLVIGWVVAFGSEFHRSGERPSTFLLDLLHPLADLAVLGALLPVLTVAWRRVLVPYLALLVLTVADSLGVGARISGGHQGILEQLAMIAGRLPARCRALGADDRRAAATCRSGAATGTRPDGPRTAVSPACSAEHRSRWSRARAPPRSSRRWPWSSPRSSSSSTAWRAHRRPASRWSSPGGAAVLVVADTHPHAGQGERRRDADVAGGEQTACATSRTGPATWC